MHTSNDQLFLAGKNIIASTSDQVALFELNRPEYLNALNSELMLELHDAFKNISSRSDIKVVVLTGNEKSFAAGADIVEMVGRDLSQNLRDNYLSCWHEMFSNFQKPVIAAVNGYALGGGCELAMMCDIIYAGRNAKFGQPEIKLGTIPGGGGTQRLLRAIGKSRAMELILSGDHITAEEAVSRGLVSKLFDPEDVVPEALKLARKISSYSLPVIQLAKEAVNIAENVSLNEGLKYERRLFHSTFALSDRKEGMSAFLEKRKANFKDC